MGPGDAPRLGGGSKPVRGTGSGGAVLQRPRRRGRWAAAGMCGVLSGSQPSPPRPVPASTLYSLAPWPHLTSPATSDHQPRPGKPRKLVLSPTAGVRRETSYGETAGRAAAPCSVSSVHSPRHTGPSRAAASESPSPPQQHGTGSRDKGRLPQLDTVVTECQHSVLTPDTD